MKSADEPISRAILISDICVGVPFIVLKLAGALAWSWWWAPAMAVLTPAYR